MSVQHRYVCAKMFVEDRGWLWDICSFLPMWVPWIELEVYFACTDHMRLFSTPSHWPVLLYFKPSASL